MSAVHRKGELIYDGPGIEGRQRDVLPQHKVVKELFDFLLHRGEMPTVGKDVLNKIFVERDKEFSAVFRQLLQDELNSPIAEGGAPLSVRERHIGHLIALIPYTYPEVGETFRIPVFQPGGVRWGEYRVDTVIQLTPSFFSSPLPAYGLQSDDPTIPPILAFLGSTYPAGDGFIASWLSDCSPFFSVGHTSIF